MLTSYISELLYTHDCVMVPGFGGFLTTYAPAEYHAKSQMLFPPHKRIAFNANLRGNDGLLANHIALVNGVSYNEAQKYIEKTVNLWLEQFEKNQQLNLPKLGNFINVNGGWAFQSDTTVNYHATAYGFAPIHVTPIHTAKYKTKVEPTKENRPPAAHPGKINKEKLYRNIAIAMPVVAILLWAILNPASIGHLYTAGLGFFCKKAPEAVSISKPIVKDNNVNVDTTVVDAVGAYTEQRFYIVAGCFQNYENAKHLVVELKKKGYPATLAGTRKGLTVVSYMNFANHREAQMGLHKIQREDPYVWVMKK